MGVHHPPLLSCLVLWIYHCSHSTVNLVDSGLDMIVIMHFSIKYC